MGGYKEVLHQNPAGYEEATESSPLKKSGAHYHVLIQNCTTDLWVLGGQEGGMGVRTLGWTTLLSFYYCSLKSINTCKRVDLIKEGLP